jgi:hypothetical protein
MYNKTFLPGDLVRVKQDAWITDKTSWTLRLTQKSLNGIYLGKLEQENESCADWCFVHPFPVRIAIHGDNEIIVDLSKINYYTKRRNYEKVN